MEVDTIDVNDHALQQVEMNNSEQSTTLSSILGKHLSDASNFPTNETWKKRSVVIQSNDHNKLLEKILEAQSPSKIKTLWKRMWKSKIPVEQQILASSPFMSKLVEKLLGSELSLEPSLVKLILSCDMLSTRVCPDLLDAILEHEDLELLTYFFQHVRDISEKDIVKSLNKLIPVKNDSLSSELDCFVHEVIKLPYTDTTLVQELRHLQFEKALVLMTHLSALLKTTDLLMNQNLNQVFTWTSLLLDAHFTQTIISSEAWQIIVDLQETIAIQMELYKDLSELDVTVSKIQNSIAAKKFEMEGKKRFLYKIEVMSI